MTQKILAQIKGGKIRALGVTTAEMKERLLAAGIDARPSTPAEFQARITRDITRWSEVVKKARIATE